jgi:hypothetical protein
VPESFESFAAAEVSQPRTGGAASDILRRAAAR